MAILPPDAEQLVVPARKNAPLKLLFVCVGNSCRSQMAEGLARAMGGDRVEVESAGTSPGDIVAPKAVSVMRELGIDISGQQPKILTQEAIGRADRVVTMGCDASEMCPAPWLANAGDWGLDDPAGQGIEKYREVRDEIVSKMEALFEREGIPNRLGKSKRRRRTLRPDQPSRPSRP
jgi:protein-tyrosine-phosphatase